MAARVLSFGSLNIDYVYQVDHIITPGETLDTTGLALHCGGKGLNQSVALARAGADVAHAGIVGADGQMLVEACRDAGVDVSRIKVGEGRSGHTIIQVDASGQNCILPTGHDRLHRRGARRLRGGRRDCPAKRDGHVVTGH